MDEEINWIILSFGIVDDESATCAIPRNGVLKKHMTRSRYTVETILMGSKVWCWRLEGHIITHEGSRCIDFVGKNTKNKRLYLNRPQIAWKGISHYFRSLLHLGNKTCSIGTGKLDVGVYLRGKSRALIKTPLFIRNIWTDISRHFWGGGIFQQPFVVLCFCIRISVSNNFGSLSRLRKGPSQQAKLCFLPRSCWCFGTGTSWKCRREEPHERGAKTNVDPCWVKIDRLVSENW